MTAPKPPVPAPVPARVPAPSAVGGMRADEACLLDELPAVEFEALQWSVRMSDGLDPQARAAFDLWLADPAHRAAYEDIAGVWDAIAEIPAEGHAQIRAKLAIDTAGQSAASSVAQDHTPAIAQPPAPMPATPLPRRSAAKALAALAGLAVLGGGWQGLRHWRSQPVFRREYASERGAQHSVELPDGSSLQLDTATRIDVILYRNRREVRLAEGQVFFAVQADAGKPFAVLAGNARITVVGTQFSVRHTPALGSQAVQVAVSEGKVRVASQDAVEESAVLLVAGQAVIADAQGQWGTVTPIAPEAIASWRHRRLDFDGLPLSQVLAEINRYADIGVQLNDPAVGRLPVTASVDLRRLRVFVQTLPRVLPVRLERRADGLEIVSSRP